MAENISPIWSAFNAGELSPLMDGRTDQDKYFNGCKKLLNMLPTIQGPAFRRAGSRYRGETKNNQTVWFGTYEQTTGLSYVLEFGNVYVRFWANRGQVLDGGPPLEVATLWDNDDLVTEDGSFALRSVQSENTMWITTANGNRAPSKLTRLGPTTWTNDKVPFINGPFQDVDPDNTITVTFGASTGAGVLLTSSAPVFTLADVGTSFYAEMQNPGLVSPWATVQTTAVNDLIRYQGNFYKATAVGTTGKTGINPPVHLFGTASDGVECVTWQYLHSGYGWMQITGYANSQQVTGTIVNYIPEQMVGGGHSTTRWAHALFNDTDGWPTTVAFFRGRLVWARKRTLAFSVPAGYDDFSTKEGPSITNNTGFVFTLAADRLDSVRWMVPNDRALLVGSSVSELAISEQTTQAVFSATNCTDLPQSRYGARMVEPVEVSEAIFFVQRAGKKLREDVLGDVGKFVAQDLTVLSPQVTEAGIVDMDFQDEPDSTLWCVLADGKMGALTYQKERGVVAWTPHTIGGSTADTDYGLVETVACISAPDGSRDDVWIVVKRVINGVTKRYVEYLEDASLYKADLTDAFFIDGGLTYSGASTKTITGLDHLEGETVQVNTAGSTQADCVVSGGSITLLENTTKAQIGLQFKSQLQTMRPDGGVQGGSSQSFFKSHNEVDFLLGDTIGGKAGPSFDRLDDIKTMNPAQLIGAAKQPFEGWAPVAWPADAGTDGYVCFEQSQPFMAMVKAIVPRTQVADD